MHACVRKSATFSLQKEGCGGFVRLPRRSRLSKRVPAAGRRSQPHAPSTPSWACKREPPTRNIRIEEPLHDLGGLDGARWSRQSGGVSATSPRGKRGNEVCRKPARGESVGEDYRSGRPVLFQCPATAAYCGMPCEHFRQERRFGEESARRLSVEIGTTAVERPPTPSLPQKGLDGDAEGISLAFRDDLHALHRVNEVSTHDAALPAVVT